MIVDWCDWRFFNRKYVLYFAAEHWYKNGRLSALKLTHNGIYHCCTFCSSGGKKEITCGCRGTMPGKN